MKQCENPVYPQQLQPCMTFGQALSQGAQFLLAQGIEDAQTDAWLLLEFVTGMSRAHFLAERSACMDPKAAKQYGELLAKRASHIPLQHLTGEQEFMGLSFRVTPDVLVPRQDTETLVEEALARLGSDDRVLDLCTGSGCIAVSLAKYGAGKVRRVDGSDVSEKALSVARENGMRNEAGVRWILSDLFENIVETYDMIVSNPPYICTDVIGGLSEEVRLHEPLLALDGKEDGLFFYRRIIAGSSAHLRCGGWLLFEIGYDQGRAVSVMMQENGYEEVRIVRDLAGKDRVVLGRLNGR